MTIAVSEAAERLTKDEVGNDVKSGKVYLCLGQCRRLAAESCTEVLLTVPGCHIDGTIGADVA